MSYPTLPAYFHTGTWDTETRSHPAMKWMEKYTTNTIDARAWTTGNTSATEWHAPDFTLYKANGEVYHGAEKAWEAIGVMFAPFQAHLHEPEFCVVWETEGGWDMLGQANMYANLHVPGSEPKVKDGTGKEWDVVTPSAFHFEYVKDDKAEHDGIKLKSTRIFADSGPALTMMLKRGQMKPADLGL